jgi:hypothetical protein
MQVQNNVKATAVSPTNANQSVARHLRVKTRLKAGRLAVNTNQAMLRTLAAQTNCQADRHARG